MVNINYDFTNERIVCMLYIYENLVNHKANIAVIGLGYVGLPVAIEFAKKYAVIGYDTDWSKIEDLKKGIDFTNEFESSDLLQPNLSFTHEEKDLDNVMVYIVTVPTPVDSDNFPDLHMVMKATECIGRNIEKHATVVYESTFYPGVTEEVCVPVIEELSGLKCGVDFKVGYSPERIDPGNKKHRFSNITKVVSAIDSDSLDLLYKLYTSCLHAEVYQADSIKVAEAAKLIENTQRDVNIALINEFSVILNKLNIDTLSVINAAGTKWNFINYMPGLVGGHCIGVDPYYMSYIARKLGCSSKIVNAARATNNDMSKYIVENLLRKFIECGINIKDSNVLVMGVTFKENWADIRNTKVIDIIELLKSYGIQVHVTDPVADPEEVKRFLGIDLVDSSQMHHMDAVIVAVKHDELVNLTVDDFDRITGENKILFDIKGCYSKNDLVEHGYHYWRL